VKEQRKNKIANWVEIGPIAWNCLDKRTRNLNKLSYFKKDLKDKKKS
jgi:hypothetical protein